MAENAGILCLELYIPKLCIMQREFEEYNECIGKYTIGLGQERMSFCSDLEDITSICLTVVNNLITRNNISHKSIGFLQVGTETLIDKSKSTKSELMRLFEEHGVHDIEGIDQKNACFGGTAAIFNALNWLESSAWDGEKFAIVVAGDIASYRDIDTRATGGAGAIALLLGPNAPLVFDRGIRSHFMSNIYDFHKPILNSEYPIVHGGLSIESFYTAVLACYKGYREKFAKKSSETVPSVEADSVDFVCFHTPFIRLVRKAFARLYHHDCSTGISKNVGMKEFLHLPFAETLGNKTFDSVIVKASETLFKQKVESTLYIAKLVGNIYTASLYTALFSLLYSFKKNAHPLLGKRILMFSYGSGCASAMFSIKTTTDQQLLGSFLNSLPDIGKLLSERTVSSIPSYLQHMQQREELTERSFSPKSNVVECIELNSYYLSEIDEQYRRHYDIRKQGI